jgi:hypothetical protein
VSEDPRDALIREAVRSFNEADVAGLMSFIHPEVRSRVAEGLGNPGTYERAEGFGLMLADWSEAWSEQQIELRQIEHVDDSASLVHTDQALVGAGSGIPVEAETTFLVVFQDGKAIRFEIHPGRDSALEALAI